MAIGQRKGSHGKLGSIRMMFSRIIVSRELLQKVKACPQSEEAVGVSADTRKLEGLTASARVQKVPLTVLRMG